MAFTPKAWQNAPSTATPLDAYGLEDLEERLSQYTDASLSPVAASNATKLPKAGAALGTAGGMKLSRDTYGTYDQASVFSVIANEEVPLTQVMGTSDPSVANERGGVAMYVGNSTVGPTVSSASTTFTATSVTFGVGVDLTEVMPGMIVDAGDKAAFVASVAGQVATITPLGWRTALAATSTPLAGTLTTVNLSTSVWTHNANVYNEDPAHTQQLVGFELGVKVARDDGTILLSASEGKGSRAYDAVALPSAGRPLFGYTSRGRFNWGYSASGMVSGAGFVYHKSHAFTPGSSVSAAFLDEDSNADVSFRARRAASTSRLLEGYVANDAHPRLSISANGTLSWGTGSSPTAASLFYAGSGIIRTDNTFHALGNVTLGSAASGVGFFGGGAAKQNVTGSRGGNAALASLLSALAAYGLLTNSSTA